MYSRALQNADVVVLLGARLNWILHFGLPPRYSDLRSCITIANVVWVSMAILKL